MSEKVLTVMADDLAGVAIVATPPLDAGKNKCCFLGIISLFFL